MLSTAPSVLSSPRLSRSSSSASLAADAELSSLTASIERRATARSDVTADVQFVKRRLQEYEAEFAAEYGRRPSSKADWGALLPAFLAYKQAVKAQRARQPPRTPPRTPPPSSAVAPVSPSQPKLAPKGPPGGKNDLLIVVESSLRTAEDFTIDTPKPQLARRTNPGRAAKDNSPFGAAAIAASAARVAAAAGKPRVGTPRPHNGTPRPDDGGPMAPIAHLPCADFATLRTCAQAAHS